MRIRAKSATCGTRCATRQSKSASLSEMRNARVDVRKLAGCGLAAAMLVIPGTRAWGFSDHVESK